MHQIAAIARYECRMQWRGRALLVITLGMLVIPIGFALMLRGELQGMRLLADSERRIALAVVPTSWFAVYVSLLVLLPVVIADMIPKDDTYGVRDLLSGLPLRTGTYILGKLFGMWLSVLLSLAFIMLVSGAIWWLLLGPLDLGLFLNMWLVGAVPLSLLNCGLSMFLAAAIRSRRGAIAVGVLFVVICLFLLMASINAPNTTKPLAYYLNPARPASFWYFSNLHEMMTIAGYDPVTHGDIWRTIAAGAAELGATAVLAGAWLRWQGRS